MLILRQIEKKDYNKVKPILKDNLIEDDLLDGIVYILENKDEIIGIGKIFLKDSYGILKYIAVEDKFRGFNYGDSILRGMLFKCQAMGINNIYYCDNSSYLIKKGFIHNRQYFSNEYKLYLKINDFFTKYCCGDKNGV
ncbi:hypothetical protein CULT_1050005 [[Clostridium] ultunense Esp]|uniref:N-acetyltransferase domain-containing protein n=1 Tax=[Clostridium] ultunense Esp TaxID=1288971 RepID=M1Z4I6_9FIRM|nr:GNAT family N-acetyltransferase [Schnuerera ultunensis]CCQ92664.1 hypothetical protein CULT_1050005 [[Clostridium] ultunense Esp]SHD77125.1 conserved protein of unknown function [[Clostridium] ultunense Esp]